MKRQKSDIYEILSKNCCEIKTVGEIAMSISVSAFSKIESYSEGNVPVIKLKNINKLKSPFIHECEARLDIKDFKRSKVGYGDILMIGNGSVGLAGRVFVYLGREECIVRQSV